MSNENKNQQTFPEYNSFPPYPYFLDVLKHSPHALRTYIDLWALQDKDGRVVLRKNQIQTILLVQCDKLKKDLYKIIDLSLASVDESPQMLVIDFIQWDDDLNDDDHFMD